VRVRVEQVKVVGADNERDGSRLGGEGLAQLRGKEGRGEGRGEGRRL
jgi:hypothetical protein